MQNMHCQCRFCVTYILQNLAQDINLLMIFSHFNGSSYFKNWLTTLTLLMVFCQFSVSCFIDAQCKLVLQLRVIEIK